MLDLAICKYDMHLTEIATEEMKFFGIIFKKFIFNRGKIKEETLDFVENLLENGPGTNNNY